MDNFYLKLVTVDPRSKQGDYMILNYEISGKCNGKNTWICKWKSFLKKGYIVAKIDDNKIAQFVDVVKKPFWNFWVYFYSF